MKQLMLGNEAVARGLYEAGCAFVSSYPGTPSTEITEAIAKYPEVYAEWAPNEKVAMEAAFGASLAGRRSFCGMKHVGLNVAADPLFTISYTGVNAGMVIGVADDAGMHSSQNEQDSRHYAMASKIPMLEPSDSAEALAFTKLAYELSEQFDTPVLLRMCTRIAHSQSVVELCEPIETVKKEYVKTPQKYIMAPANAIRRHPFVEQRMADIEKFALTSNLNRVEMNDTKIGFITSGIPYQYVKEACPNASVLKLGMVHPLPKKLIEDFAAEHGYKYLGSNWGYLRDETLDIKTYMQKGDTYDNNEENSKWVWDMSMDDGSSNAQWHAWRLLRPSTTTTAAVLCYMYARQTACC